MSKEVENTMSDGLGFRVGFNLSKTEEGVTYVIQSQCSMENHEVKKVVGSVEEVLHYCYSYGESGAEVFFCKL